MEHNTFPNPNFMILNQNKSNLASETLQIDEQVMTTNPRVRRDRVGTQIKKGNKRHLVTFSDQVGTNLIDRVEVESYKTFNMIHKQPIDSCSCVVCRII